MNKKHPPEALTRLPPSCCAKGDTAIGRGNPGQDGHWPGLRRSHLMRQLGATGLEKKAGKNCRLRMSLFRVSYENRSQRLVQKGQPLDGLTALAPSRCVQGMATIGKGHPGQGSRWHGLRRSHLMRQFGAAGLEKKASKNCRLRMSLFRVSYENRSQRLVQRVQPLWALTALAPSRCVQGMAAIGKGHPSQGSRWPGLRRSHLMRQLGATGLKKKAGQNGCLRPFLLKACYENRKARPACAAFSPDGFAPGASCPLSRPGGAGAPLLAAPHLF